jgi:protein TonB
MRRESEKINGYVAASTIFHVAVFAVVIFYPSLFPMRGDSNWGSPAAGDGGINARIVDSIPGVPLPAPPVVREEAAANESSSLNPSEPTPPPPPPPDDAIPVPDPKAPAKKTATPRPAKTPPSTSKTKAPPEEPTNAVPGQGGQPNLEYGQFSTGAGSAGSMVGDGTFGDRYGWYVDALNRRISQNWLRSLVDNRVSKAPRVYLSFTIARDGTISNVEIKQSSGIPTLDRSAHRAILASNPLAPLPSDYRGSSVTVSFYFEFVR